MNTLNCHHFYPTKTHTQNSLQWFLVLEELAKIRIRYVLDGILATDNVKEKPMDAIPQKICTISIPPPNTTMDKNGRQKKSGKEESKATTLEVNMFNGSYVLPQKNVMFP